MKKIIRSMFILAMIMAGMESYGLVNPTFVGRWGYGPCWAEEPTANYTYMGSGCMFMIMNNTNPASLQVVGTLMLPDNVQSIKVVGTLAYVAASSGGLRIINISNPAAPAEVGSLVIGWGMDLAVSGNYVYLADWTSGMKIINISNPVNPQLAGSYSTVGAAYGIDLSGNYAYVTDDQYGLRILNVQNPASPVLTGSCATSGGASDVSIQGNYAYVSDNLGGMRIISISNPNLPALIGTFQTTSQVFHVALNGNYAYVAAANNGLLIVNISNPNSPQQVGSFSMPDANSIGYYNNLAWVGSFDYGMYIINVSLPSNPYQAGYYSTAGWSTGIALKDTFAYLSAGQAGLRIIDISNPALPLESAHDSTFYGSVTISDNYLYVAKFPIGMKIMSLANPLHPVQTGSINTPGIVAKIEVAGNYAYLAAGAAGIRIVDISNPASPFEVGSYTAVGYAADIALQGTFAYVHDSWQGLKILDISNPSLPTLAGSLTYTGQGGGIAVSGNYVYFANTYLGLRIINVANPASPNEVAVVNIWAADVILTGYYAYVGNSVQGVTVVNINSPSSPVILGYYSTPGQVETDVFCRSALLYIPDEMDGMEIVAVPPYVTISGNDTACLYAESNSYTTQPGNSDYTWNLSSGGIITSGAGTDSITVTWTTTGAKTVSVNYTTPYGFTGICNAVLNVTVVTIPDAPVIMLNGDTLTSSAPAGNQWYYEGNPVPGATGQTYIATQNGAYWSIVTLNDCASDPSNHIIVIVSGMEFHPDPEIQLYPIPNNGQLSLSISTHCVEIFNIAVYDAVGVKVYELSDLEVNHNILKIIDLRPVKPGIYLVRITSSKSHEIRKMYVF